VNRLLRRPAVAGTFYPADPARLDALVADLLAGAARAVRPEALRSAAAAGLLVPHAGLSYSGSIAALGWALAGEIGPTTIVLAGTDHQAWAAGVGVWTAGSWLSPLGEVAIDEGFADELVALGPPFAADEPAHLAEHSLEVQLPLLTRTCPGARIVPLAVSPRLESHAQAGVMLGRLIARRREGGERILLVASSDLAHYPPVRVCEETDAKMLEPLLRLDAEGLRAQEAAVVGAGRRGLLCGLCGIDPVRVTLGALVEMGATRGVVLGTATSADAGGDPGRTVGYAAAAFV